MKIINAWWQSMLGSFACSGVIIAENDSLINFLERNK